VFIEESRVRSISSITDIPALESYVRTIIYTEDRFAKTTDEEKLELFGKFFQHNPTFFFPAKEQLYSLQFKLLQSC
jgi:hypothetical protein